MTGLATSTRVVHGVKLNDEYGSLAPPVYHTSTYFFENCDQGADAFGGRSSGFMYSRMGNPSVRSLELKIADLEGAEAAAGTSSAMAALSSIVFSFLNDGDHVLVDSHLSPEALELFSTLSKFGIQSTIANTTNLSEFLGNIRSKTKLVIVITPAPPLLISVDIAAVARAAKRVNAIVVVDSSFATPVITKPISFGADLVLLNASGILTGHSDVIGGLVCGPTKYILPIKSIGVKDMVGCPMSPEDATLAIRGIQTLDLRLFEASENARAIAQFLDGDAVVKKVFHPGDSEVARKQMSQFGNMVGFQLDCKRSEIYHFLDALQLIQLSETPGGNTTVVHLVDKVVFEYGSPEEKMAVMSMMQLSVGIEDVHDVTADLNRGLNAIAKLKRVRRTGKREKISQGNDQYRKWIIVGALIVPIFIGFLILLCLK
jgi:methionine-gamma-lyase